MRLSPALLALAWLALLPGPLTAAPCADADRLRVDPRPVLNGFGLNAHNHRFIGASLAGLTPQNIHRLRLKWVFALPDTESPRAVPLVTPDTLVIADNPGTVYALDRDSGCEKWRFDAGAMVRTALRHVKSGDDDLVVLGTFDAELIALNLADGSLRWRLDADAHPRAMLSGSAVDHAGVIYQPVSSYEVMWALNPFYACCTFRSSVLAVAAGSGDILWRAYTVEEAPRVVKSRWIRPDHLGPSGAPVWSQPTLDLVRGRIYVATGENYSSPATDTSDAILAFDLHSGKLLWKRQLLAGDAWNLSCVSDLHHNCPDERGEDLDFGAPPILATVAGRDYLLAGQKSGRVFALDPTRQGAVLWSHKAGAGGKMGGVHFAMAADPERGVLYVPISDRPAGGGEGQRNPSLQAFAIADGERLWSTPAPGDCIDRSGAEPEPVDDCFRGFSAAVTATEHLVLAPTLDGVLRIFDAATGAQLWSFDTRRSFTAVNGGEARGGAFDVGGVFAADGQLFVSSGYGQFGQLPGNAFMVFEVAPEGS